ncbi:HAD family phosphatase [Candidatus Woesearchaeota archaeon]|nr:HAD family phosphatase [Candidatus Woesearchaeota archaeon]
MSLVIFDSDGVLLDVVEGGFKYLARAIGKNKEVDELHAEYERRKHLGPWGLEQLAELFKGEKVERIRIISYEFCKEHLMKGTIETITEIRRRKHTIAILSSNPIIILEEIQKIIGIVDSISGNELEVVGGVYTGKLLRKVDRYIKAQDALTLIKKLGLPKEKVWIIGDSITDKAMSEYGMFIAFNPKKEIEGITTNVVRTKDLIEILKYIN